MSDPCPTCDETVPVGPVHSLLIPKINPDIGSPAPTDFGPCPQAEPAGDDVCHDGYRIPIIIDQSTTPEICSTWDVATPCAVRWAYPGLLVEIYPLGYAEITAVATGSITLKNLTIEPDSIVAHGLTMRPIPKTPSALQGIPDAEVQDPANYESEILSQNIRFLVAEYIERCGIFWKPTARKGMCGLPLTTAVGVSSLRVPLWNPTTGCFHFLPNGDEGDALVIRDGKPVWFSASETKVVFVYTGSQQQITVPDWATSVEIKCWGAGGSWDGGVNGGVGGFTRVKMPVGTIGSTEVIKQTEQLSVIVGQGQHDILGPVFGFGGDGQGGAHQHNGGGLAGVFLGGTPVLQTDFTRAIVIAGGGGAGGWQGGTSPRQYGGNGNTTTGATMPDMKGQIATGGVGGGTGGGGGGYRGGIGLQFNGYGGSGFTHADATEVELLFVGNVVVVDPPKIVDPDYVSGVGRQGQPGRVVMQFFET
jgi:hypothetical protein